MYEYDIDGRIIGIYENGYKVRQVPEFFTTYILNFTFNNNGQIVWEQYDTIDGEQEIFLYDGSFLVNLSDNTDIQDGRPAINDNGDIIFQSPS